MINLQALHEEVLGGLGNQNDRIEEDLENANFFRGDFPDDVRGPSTAWEGARFERSSRIMTWLVETLAANLYSAGPGRSLADHREASDWLNKVYKASCIDALMQSADQWSTVSQVAAIQAIPNEDPARPVRHALWPSHQLCVWESEEDPLKPEAVATIDRYDNRRRVRLWTLDRRLTYQSEKLTAGQTAGGRELKLVGEEANPFGILPFSFVHYNFPTTQFYAGGPGRAFKEMNDYVNFSLTDSGDSIRYCGKPIVKALGVRAGWRPSTPIRPGDIWDIPAEGIDADGNGIPPDVSYLLPPMEFIEGHWYDLQNYLDHGMQCAGVPTTLFRLTNADAASGLAIIAEQLPLILRAEGRQRPFASYEADLCKVTLTVGAVHLGANGVAGSEALREAAADPDLSLRWPCMRPKLANAETDTSNTIALQEQTKSRTQIVMERERLTREEAEAYLDQVQKDLLRERALFAALAEPGPGVDDPTGNSPAGADDPDLNTEPEKDDEDA